MKDIREIYFFHGETDVVVSFFKDDKLINYFSVSKRKLGEELVEKFFNLLKDCNISLEEISSIYLSNSFSTWNASRLVTLFVKSLVFFKDIDLFSKDESLDKKDVDLELKKFVTIKKNFKLIYNPEELKPLYREGCPTISI